MAKIIVRYVAKKQSMGFSGKRQILIFFIQMLKQYFKSNQIKNQVVEFECDPKYLKGHIVDKGLWRVNSDPNYKVLINLKETKYGFSEYSLFCFVY